MEKITKHIETLVRRHDYVIVPELGGFIFQKQKASITTDSQLPPRTIISFNPLMSASDGLLAIELSRAETISFREAIIQIQQSVQFAKQQLAAGKSVQVGQIGQLYRGDENKTLFRQSEKADFIPTNYGLYPLHFNAYAEDLENQTKERKVIRIVLPTAKTFTRYAAMAAMLTGVIWATPKLNQTYQNFGSFDFISKVKQMDFVKKTPFVQETPVEIAEKIETPALVDVIDIASDSLIAQTSEEVSPAISEMQQEPEAMIVRNHHVIVSAMAKESDAEAYCQRLVALEYTNAHVLEPIKTYRIAIASFETKDEAIQYMLQLRKEKPQFADAWVLSE